MKIETLFNGNDYSFNIISENKGDKVEPHHHNDWDETWFIIEGKYKFIIGYNTIIAYPMQTVFAHRKIVHSVECLEDNSKRIAIFKDGVEIHYED